MFGYDRSEYFQMLNSFKYTLLNLYTNKTKFIAERETLRFKYMTQDKAKLLNIKQAMYDELIANNESNAIVVFNFVMSLILQNIPMYQMTGAMINGWGRFAGSASEGVGKVSLNDMGEFWRGYSVGSSEGSVLSYLSPIAHFFQPLLVDRGPDGNEPFYKYDYLTFVKNKTSPDRVLAGSFLGQKSFDPASSLAIEFPPRYEYVQSIAASQNRHINQYDYMLVQEILKMTYPVGNMKDVLVNMMDELRRIVELTFIILDVQIEIDAVESELANYVSQYAGQVGESLAASDLMKDIQLAADGDAAAMRRLGLFTTEAEKKPIDAEVQVIVDEAKPIEVAPQEILPTESKRSNLPLLIAAGVGLALLVM